VAAIVAAEATAAEVPIPLLSVTARSAARVAQAHSIAAGLVSTSVDTLARGELTMMFVSNLMKPARAVLAVSLISAIVGLAAQLATGERPAAAAGPSAQGDVEKELIRLQRQWAAAVVNQDGAALDRILADDFVVTGPTGHVSSRQELLDMVAGGVSQVESLEVDDMIVHVYPSAAVILGRSTYKTRPGRADLAGSYRWTNTYVRLEGRWRCIAAQEGSRVAPAVAPEGVPKFDPNRFGNSQPGVNF
jgi:ketosteroid isomerase-like protein